MATTTTTYGFATPTAGTEDNTWGALLNANFDELDDLLDGTDQIECIRLKSAAMAADALDPDDGNIQTRTLAANTTFTDSLADGDQILLHISGGSTYTVTWPTITWHGGAEPTLTTIDAVLVYKVGSTLYGAYGGTLA